VDAASKAFAARRMNRAIAQAIAGRRVDEVAAAPRGGGGGGGE
jgi:hypothetical protein